MKEGSRSASGSSRNSQSSGTSHPHPAPKATSCHQQNDEGDFEPDAPNSDDGNTGGLSECDEKDGDERRVAKESPAKGKRRLDSKVCNLDSLLPNCPLFTRMAAPH